MHKLIRRSILAGCLILNGLLAHGNEASQTLQTLFHDDWEWQMRQFPAYASTLGDHRFDGRLTDYDAGAVAERRAHPRDALNRLVHIDRDQLDEQDRLSFDLFRHGLESSLAIEQFYLTHPFSEEWTLLGHLDGIHIQFSQMVATTRFENAADYRNYLARLRAFPVQALQAMQITRQALRAGWSLPEVTVRRVPGQIDRLIGQDPMDSSWFSPFRRMPENIADADRDAIAAEAKTVFLNDVTPALLRLKSFLLKEYLPKTRRFIAAGRLPGGPEYYRALVRQYTTTKLTPAAVHTLGLSEVQRLRVAMNATAKEAGFGGNGISYIAAIRKRPNQYFATGQELLDAYAAIGNRVTPRLPGLFATLPRQRWEVRAAGPEEQGNSAYYQPGAPDGSRPAYFVADVSRPREIPRFDMTALFLHEAVPGHHLQNAVAAELTNLPEFRKHGWYVAYGEGWALYAESLGDEMGLYDTPEARMGRYSYEMWRAARLVVDTGIHALGWSRQRAIDFMQRATGDNPAEIASEIDRYIAWPGQALGYKIGELTLLRLRQQAKEQLGNRFDLRAFHELVLSSGALPLSILEQRVNDWIKLRETGN